MAGSWQPKDNTFLEAKVELRKRYLPKKAHVLDLFCGDGNMYRQAYEGRVASYRGVDNKKIFDRKLCSIANNELYVVRHDMVHYNVFDLDDWGCPWKLLYLILRKARQPEITFFITDGSSVHEQRTGAPAKLQSAIERIPAKMNIPGLSRWYIPMFMTMLVDLERRYGYKTVKAVYLPNKGKRVYYWAIRMTKSTTKKG